VTTSLADCLGALIVPVPSGYYLHPGEPHEIATSQAYDFALYEPVYPGRTRVFLGRPGRNSALVDRYLDARAGRTDLLLHIGYAITPGSQPDQSAARWFADRYKLPVEVREHRLPDRYSGRARLDDGVWSVWPGSALEQVPLWRNPPDLHRTRNVMQDWTTLHVVTAKAVTGTGHDVRVADAFGPDLGQLIGTLARSALSRHPNGLPMPRLRLVGLANDPAAPDIATFARRMLREELRRAVAREIGLDDLTAKEITDVADAITIGTALEAPSFPAPPAADPANPVRTLPLWIETANLYSPLTGLGTNAMADEILRQALDRLWRGYAADGRLVGSSFVTGAVRKQLHTRLGELRAKSAAVGIDDLLNPIVHMDVQRARPHFGWRIAEPGGNNHLLAPPQVWNPAEVTHLELNVRDGGLQPATLEDLKAVAWQIVSQPATPGGRPQESELTPDGTGRRPHRFQIVTYAVDGQAIGDPDREGLAHAQRVAEVLRRQIAELLVDLDLHGVERTLEVVTAPGTVGQILHGNRKGPARWGVAIRYAGVDQNTVPMIGPRGARHRPVRQVPVVRAAHFPTRPAGPGQLDRASRDRIARLAVLAAGHALASRRKEDEPRLTFVDYRTPTQDDMDRRGLDTAIDYFRTRLRKEIITALRKREGRSAPRAPKTLVDRYLRRVRIETLPDKVARFGGEVPVTTYRSREDPNNPLPTPVPIDVEFFGMSVNRVPRGNRPPALDHVAVRHSALLTVGPDGWWRMPAADVVTDVDARIARYGEAIRRSQRLSPTERTEVRLNLGGGLLQPPVRPAMLAYDYAVTRVRLDDQVVRVHRLPLNLYVDPNAVGAERDRLVEAMAELKKAAEEAVALINTRYRMPNGDQFHLWLDFVDDPSASANPVVVTSEAIAPGAAATSGNWPASLLKAGPGPYVRRVLLHEMFHITGVWDNYRAWKVSAFPFFRGRRNVAQAELRGPRPSEYSLMGRTGHPADVRDEDLAPDPQYLLELAFMQQARWGELQVLTETALNSGTRLLHESLSADDPIVVPNADGKPVEKSTLGNGFHILATAAPAAPARKPVVGLPHQSLESVRARLGVRSERPGGTAVALAVVDAFDRIGSGRGGADRAIARVATELADPDAKAAWLGHVLDVLNDQSDPAVRQRLQTVAELVIHCR
jgi:hypothetical protein